MWTSFVDRRRYYKNLKFESASSKIN